MSAHPLTPELSQSVIIASIHCRRCGYDLRGLTPTGQCPECGLEIWQTILSTVDPAASHLPKLRNPAGVGDGLLAVVLALLLSGLGYVVRPAAVGLDNLRILSGVRLSPWTPRGLAAWAGGVALGLGLWGVWRLAPPPGKEPPGPVWRDVKLLGGGLATWSMLVLAGGIIDVLRVPDPATVTVRLLMYLAAVMALLGLDGVLAVIGMRSREYRTSRQGRQSAQAMIAAAVFGASGDALAVASGLWSLRWGLDVLGRMLSWAAGLMLLIGSIYMVWNAWWIRRALRRPPPTLQSLLAQARH